MKWHGSSYVVVVLIESFQIDVKRNVMIGKQLEVGRIQYCGVGLSYI